jgi:hypothetical protein
MDALAAGLAEIEPVLAAHGFAPAEPPAAGNGSGWTVRNRGHDLERFCGDFLAGDGAAFRAAVEAAPAHARRSGIGRLAEVEARLRRG